MCLSDLGKIVRFDRNGHQAVVDQDGRHLTVSTIALGLDAPDLQVGEWLVVHTGLAVERISAHDAEQIRQARRQLEEQEPEEHPWN